MAEEIKQVGDYRLLQKLGEGKAGLVYLATPIKEKSFARPGDPVAIKLYKSEILKHPNQSTRINREAKIGQQLSHPNLVRIYEYHIEETSPTYLVMEFVDGITLDAWLSMFHPISSDYLLLTILIQLIDGIYELHQNNITHRDIKPSNIMLSPTFQIKLMDLGVVEIKHDDKITPEHKFLGSIRNSSPEMLFCKTYDYRTDLYSFGTVMYALLHGREIFHEVSPTQFAELVVKVKEEQPDYDPSLENQVVRAKLLELTQALLDKDPMKRLNSAQIVKEKLEEIRSSIKISPSFEPMHGYIATALTDVPKEARDTVAFTSSKIAEVCKQYNLYVYQPRKATDPLTHPDIDATAVYLKDRKRVVDSDVIIVLANWPSFGVGQEIEIAAGYGIPTILIMKEGVKVSRMVRGSFANFVDESIVYTDPEDLDRKLRKFLMNNINKLREWKRNKRPSQSRSEISSKLFSLRSANCYSIEHVADTLGVSERMLSSVEKGDYDNIGIAILNKMCELYRIQIHELSGSYLSTPQITPGLEDPNIQKLENLAMRLGWNTSDYIELKKDYLKEVAASGAQASPSNDEWRARHAALEKRKLRDMEASVKEESKQEETNQGKLF